MLPFASNHEQAYEAHRVLNAMENRFKNHFSFVHMKTDIIDKGNVFLLRAELPGFKKENIDIELKDNQLVIKAKREDFQEEENEKYVLRERQSASFCRSFDVSDIKTDEIKAQYVDGILTLYLPKKEEIPKEESVKKIPIE
jgi:HSP20 family protein